MYVCLGNYCSRSLQLLLVSIGGVRGQWLWGTIASAEHEPITGVWEQTSQRGPGAEPWSGGQAP